MAERPGIGVLVSHVVRDAKALLAAQVSLTKAEVRHVGQEVAVVSIAGLLAVAGVSMAMLFGLIALAFGLAELGMPAWAGFLSVTGLLLLTAVIAGVVAKVRSGKITGLSVAQSEWQETTDAVSHAMGVPPAHDAGGSGPASNGTNRPHAHR